MVTIVLRMFRIVTKIVRIVTRIVRIFPLMVWKEAGLARMVMVIIIVRLILNIVHRIVS